MAIETVAVIGAGVMGSGIAAQIANAGKRVLLLDVASENGASRSEAAEAAVARMLKTEPAPLMHKRNVKRIETGNIEDDLARVSGCDWIIEVVAERLDIKQALYKRIDAVRRPGTPVTSNTSTIPLARLTEGMSDAMRGDFFITHFFNPPRYMRLLEIVKGPQTRPGSMEPVLAFADRSLGKTLVHCKDSPGFLANRLGVYWLSVAVSEAARLGVTVEEADAILGRPVGIPKTGVFGLLDLVGLDLMPHVNASLKGALAPDDAFNRHAEALPFIGRMIAEGYTGRKGRGGFYRLIKAGTSRSKEVIDLATGAYRPEVKADLPELETAKGNLRALVTSQSKAGRYAASVLGKTLAYAASLVPSASESVDAIDEAMRLGYNWKWGPFELIDTIGCDWLVALIEAEQGVVPPALAQARGTPFYTVEAGRRQVRGLDGTYAEIARPEGVVRLAELRLSSKPLLKNASASVWDVGDGVLCLEFTSKSNTIDQDIIGAIGKAIELVQAGHKALVIYNEGSNFSLGANLGLAMFAVNIAAWGEIERLIADGQAAFRAMRAAPFPVVGAPAGMALGGGCEILLHCDAIQAHAETYAGLVECGVGLIPGWGGCAAMLARWGSEPGLPRGPMPAPARVFEMISTARVSKSADEARDMLILRKHDGITMNRDRLLADAKARALALVDEYKPPVAFEMRLPGPSGRLGMQMAAEGFARRGLASRHDVTVAGALANVLCGGETDIIDMVGDDAIHELERREFMRLIKTGATQARIEHTLATGKPLRN